MVMADVEGHRNTKDIKLVQSIPVPEIRLGRVNLGMCGHDFTVWIVSG